MNNPKLAPTKVNFDHDDPEVEDLKKQYQNLLNSYD